jgi:radical SAM protein with 4Fe4S-binding SPASM domain
MDAARERGVTLRLPRRAPRESHEASPRCDWPWTGAYVSYQGEAMPCCMIGTPDRGSFGNALEHGVAATWTGEAARAFRSRLASDSPPAVCRSCALYRGTF